MDKTKWSPANRTGKKISKTAVASIVIVLVLVIAFSIALPLYLKDYSENRELYKLEKITLSENGNQICTLTMEEIIKSVDVKTFSAVYKPSGKLPITNEYKGILLSALFKRFGIDIEHKSSIVFGCRDGERMQNIAYADNSTYLAYLVNGKPIVKDSVKGENGGPYVVIPADEPTSQNRVKWLVSIDVVD